MPTEVSRLTRPGVPGVNSRELPGVCPPPLRLNRYWDTANPVSTGDPIYRDEAVEECSWPLTFFWCQG